jgi:hypothetical protein
MTSEHEPDTPATSTEKEPSPAAAPPPRGNPETDQDSVRKGAEQLDKVSGN